LFFHSFYGNLLNREQVEARGIQSKWEGNIIKNLQECLFCFCFGCLFFKLYLRFFIERFSNECLKTKSTVISSANHNKHKLPNEPIRTRSKIIHVTGAKRGKMRVNRSRLI